MTVFSQSWESAEDDSFIESVDELKSFWYFRVPSDSEIDGVEAYNHDDGISFITTQELTFAEAKAKAEKLSALAYMPVL